MAVGSSDLTLVIDQGGHASRALVFAADGSLRAHALQEVKTTRVGTDRVEHDPEEVLESIHLALLRTSQALGPQVKQVVHAALATQRSSIVCWDKFTGAALSPVISWQDRRAHAWMRGFEPHAERVHQTTGLFLSPHYGVSKLRWCLDNLPQVAEAYRQKRLFFGPLASFLMFRLLSLRPFLIDPVNASRMLLLDLRRLQWDAGMQDLFGVPGECLPRVVPNLSNYGVVQFGARWIPLKLCIGDQSASLYAQGEPRADVAYVNVGSGAFVQRAVGHQPVYHARMLSGVLVQRDAQATAMYSLEGTVNGAGTALKWISEELSIGYLEHHLPEWLQRREPPPIFLNGVSGIGSPFWVSHFRSRFVGPGDNWQNVVAVLESIVFLLQSNLAEMRTAEPLREIIISGGTSQLGGFCQRLADLSGLTVVRPTMHEATSRGLSYLLSPARGAWVASRSAQMFTPQRNPELSARYARWRSLLETAITAEPRPSEA